MMQEYPDNHFDLVIADPPYNINKAEWDNVPDYLNWSMAWINECQRVLKDNGSMYIFALMENQFFLPGQIFKHHL